MLWNNINIQSISSQRNHFFDFDIVVFLLIVPFDGPCKVLQYYITHKYVYISKTLSIQTHNSATYLYNANLSFLITYEALLICRRVLHFYAGSIKVPNDKFFQELVNDL